MIHAPPPTLIRYDSRDCVCRWHHRFLAIAIDAPCGGKLPETPRWLLRGPQNHIGYTFPQPLWIYSNCLVTVCFWWMPQVFFEKNKSMLIVESWKKFFIVVLTSKNKSVCLGSTKIWTMSCSFSQVKPLKLIYIVVSVIEMVWFHYYGGHFAFWDQKIRSNV